MSSNPAAYGDPQTRTHILDTARELLESNGPVLNLADVARRAGVSRQAVYLHFGDRTGMLLALVDHIDRSQGREEMVSYVHGAATGVEALRRWVETMGHYTAKIDRIAQVLEAGQPVDGAVAAAWNDRMNGRLNWHIRPIVERIESDGRLRRDLTVDTAAQLIYILTMPGPWRELTRRLEWSVELYTEQIYGLLERGLLTAGPRSA